MATPGYNARLFITNPDGSLTPVTSLMTSLPIMREPPELVPTEQWIATLSGQISEGFRKRLYFELHFPRPGHVAKRGPWHQRLPHEYLTRKERRKLRRRHVTIVRQQTARALEADLFAAGASLDRIAQARSLLFLSRGTTVSVGGPVPMVDGKPDISGFAETLSQCRVSMRLDPPHHSDS